MYRLTTPTNMTGSRAPFDFDGYIAVRRASFSVGVKDIASHE